MAYRVGFNGCLPDYETTGKPRFLFIKWDFSDDVPLVEIGVIYGSIGSSHVVAKVFDIHGMKSEGDIEIIPISGLCNEGKFTFGLFELRNLDSMMGEVNKYLVRRYGQESKIDMQWVPEVMDYRMMDKELSK